MKKGVCKFSDKCFFSHEGVVPAKPFERPKTAISRDTDIDGPPASRGMIALRGRGGRGRGDHGTSDDRGGRGRGDRSVRFGRGGRAHIDSSSIERESAFRGRGGMRRPMYKIEYNPRDGEKPMTFKKEDEFEDIDITDLNG
jgi:hypothetical protein